MTRPSPDGSVLIRAVHYPVQREADAAAPDVLMFGVDLRGAELPARAGQSAHKQQQDQTRTV